MDNYIRCYENAVTDDFCDLLTTKFESQYFEHEEWPKDKADLINGQHYFTKDGKLKLVKDKKVLTWNPKSSKFE